MTLFTSDTKYKKEYLRSAKLYGAVSGFLLMFGGIYEIYSHNVMSFYMIYAFLIPLCGGVLINVLVAHTQLGNVNTGIASQVYNMGIATLTVGSLIRGALEIYGTGNKLIYVFYYVGAVLIFAGVTLFSVKVDKTI